MAVVIYKSPKTSFLDYKILYIEISISHLSLNYIICAHICAISYSLEVAWSTNTVIFGKLGFFWLKI